MPKYIRIDFESALEINRLNQIIKYTYLNEWCLNDAFENSLWKMGGYGTLFWSVIFVQLLLDEFCRTNHCFGKISAGYEQRNFLLCNEQTVPLYNGDFCLIIAAYGWGRNLIVSPIRRRNLEGPRPCSLIWSFFTMEKYRQWYWNVCAWRFLMVRTFWKNFDKIV